ncbi:MAG: outer membrane beta-barrel protein [Saprospiraceae bacterium]|nr:outer membrane beta-barrel protein [Saprospiraceae bacterium]
MLYLHRLQIIALFCLALIPLTGSAQYSKGNHNFRDFQNKAYYFGLTFGYNSSNFQIAYSKNAILNDSFRVVEGIRSPGLNVSMIANMKLGEYFDFRFLPGFSFVNHKISYLPTTTNSEQVRDIESVLVQIPFQVRFKSDPFHDMRVFVLGGIKYTYDVASNARIREEQANRAILLSPHDFAVEVGGGFQFFFPFFIFSPELKYSQGIGNVLIYNNKLEQTNIAEKVFSRAFTISLHFEG